MMENINNLCSILVNSCDAYRTTWSPFFTLFDKYYKDCPFKVYLNTEKEKCNFNNVVTLNSNASSWSERLISCLQAIDTKYVILLLDDFFIQKNVDSEFILNSIKIMEEDEKINCIYFKKISTNYLGDYNSSFSIMDPSKKYALNFQASIWNRNDLLRLLPKNGDAWFIEEQTYLGEEKLFLCMKKGSTKHLKNDVFNYLWSIKTGYGVCKSKWLWNNPKLFKKENITVNFFELGFLKKSQYYKSAIKLRFSRNRKEK